jgi:hypothetical protein
LCGGCATDSPTKGIPATKLQMSQSIDKSLDDLAAMPPEKRGIAFTKLQKPIVTKGTEAQKARWKDLMKGVQPLMPLRRSSAPPPPGG